MCDVRVTVVASDQVLTLFSLSVSVMYLFLLQLSNS